MGPRRAPGAGALTSRRNAHPWACHQEGLCPDALVPAPLSLTDQGNVRCPRDRGPPGPFIRQTGSPCPPAWGGSRLHAASLGRAAPRDQRALAGQVVGTSAAAPTRPAPPGAAAAPAGEGSAALRRAVTGPRSRSQEKGDGGAPAVWPQGQLFRTFCTRRPGSDAALAAREVPAGPLQTFTLSCLLRLPCGAVSPQSPSPRQPGRPTLAPTRRARRRSTGAQLREGSARTRSEGAHTRVTRKADHV